MYPVRMLCIRNGFLGPSACQPSFGSEREFEGRALKGTAQNTGRPTGLNPNL
jgi:hypothetical protein